MPLFHRHKKSDTTATSESPEPKLQHSESFSAPAVSAETPAPKPLAEQYAQELKDRLRANLDLEVDRRASKFVAPEDALQARASLTPTPKVLIGGDLFVTVHTLTGLPKKLHLVPRKVFHCIVTCGSQCAATRPCTASDDVVNFEHVLSFTYTGQPLMSVEIFDSASHFHPFRSLGKADIILSQALLRSAGWHGSRELMDPHTNGKLRGIIRLSILYSNHL